MHRWSTWSWLILTGLFFFTGCIPVDGSQALPFTTLGHKTHLRNLSLSPVKDVPEIFILADTQDIDSFLQQVAGTPPQLGEIPSPLEQLHAIDYSQSMVVLVTQGVQGSPGYQVTVQQVRQKNDIVRVYAAFTKPETIFGGSVAVGQMYTDPYHLISIPKTGLKGKQIRFELIDNNAVVATITRTIP